MKKESLLHDLWIKRVTKRLPSNIGSKAWLIIDSTIKGKRGKKSIICKNSGLLRDIPSAIALLLPCLSAKMAHNTW